MVTASEQNMHFSALCKNFVSACCLENSQECISIEKNKKETSCLENIALSYKSPCNKVKQVAQNYVFPLSDTKCVFPYIKINCKHFLSPRNQVPLKGDTFLKPVFLILNGCMTKPVCNYSTSTIHRKYTFNMFLAKQLSMMFTQKMLFELVCLFLLNNAVLPNFVLFAL